MNDKKRPESWWDGNAQPMPFDALTKVNGNHRRHIEQLWDEIKRLKERVSKLENQNDLEKNKQSP